MVHTHRRIEVRRNLWRFLWQPAALNWANLRTAFDVFGPCLAQLCRVSQGRDLVISLDLCPMLHLSQRSEPTLSLWSEFLQLQLMLSPLLVLLNTTSTEKMFQEQEFF